MHLKALVGANGVDLGHPRTLGRVRQAIEHELVKADQFVNEEGRIGPLLYLSRLLLPPQSHDALFDGLGFLLQVFQVLFEPGDLFSFGPEAWPKVGTLTPSAGSTVVPCLV